MDVSVRPSTGGSEVVFLGGRDNAGVLLDGAAYDPAADSWSRFPGPSESRDDSPPKTLLLWSTRHGVSEPIWMRWEPAPTP